MKILRVPGLLGYVSIVMWFLLMLMMPEKANAAALSDPSEKNLETVQISAADILPSIETALYAKGAAHASEIILDRPETILILNQGSEPVFDSVSFNPISGKFLLRVRGVENNHSITIAGRASQSVEVPVLNRAIPKGEVIHKDDISLVMRDDLRPNFYLSDSSDLIGKQSRRQLHANTPLRKSDVTSPILVNKGSLATVTFSGSGLRLSHQGIAQKAGAMGDVVSFENVKSNRTIRAVIIGANRAKVVSSNNLAAK